MKHVGIITFHAAHNYGSMLQNYALQQAILKHCDGWSPVTINMRSDRQKEQYDWFKPFYKLKDKRRAIFSLIYAPWKKDLQQKRQLFEDFLSQRINLSSEVSELTTQSLPFDFDAYIAGSDQIWNIRAYDFSWNYFLNFVSRPAKKIAYAASMGTSPESLHSDFMANEQLVLSLLNDFDAISAREAKTAHEINRLTNGALNPNVVCDPTLLLSADEWMQLVDDTPIVNGGYIFLYNPYYLGDVYKQAETLSRELDLPIVISNLTIKTVLYHRGLKKVLRTGPIEFLNLVKNARYIVGRSFHLAVFSILFRRPLFAVNASGDSRLNNILSLLDLTEADTKGDILGSIDRVEKLNYDKTRIKLADLRQNGIDFLKNNLA